MSHLYQREFRALVMEYKHRHDLLVDKTANQHWRVRDPKTGAQAICSSGSGDPRAVRHARSDFEKIFGKEKPMSPSAPPSNGSSPPSSMPVLGLDQVFGSPKIASPEILPEPPQPESPAPKSPKQKVQLSSWREAINKIRTANKLTNDSLADLLGVGTATTSRWLQGFLPHESRKANFEDLFGDNFDFSKLTWGTGPLFSRKPSEPITVEPPVTPPTKDIQMNATTTTPIVTAKAPAAPSPIAKDAAYWASIANLYTEIQKRGIDLNDFMAFGQHLTGRSPPRP